MESEHYDQREAMHEVRSREKSAASDSSRCSTAPTWQEKANPSWLQSVGFKVATMSEEWLVASIQISNYGGYSGDAHLDLHLVNHGDDEWVTDIHSYNEQGEHETSVGLVESWCTTKADVAKLCDALGITLST